MARDYQEVGLDSPTPPPAADFPVLVLKWDELCHRNHIQENLHPPVRGHSSQEGTLHVLPHRLHPERYTQACPDYCCQDAFNVTVTFQPPPPTLTLLP